MKEAPTITEAARAQGATRELKFQERICIVKIDLLIRILMMVEKLGCCRLGANLS